jgi:lysophospholipid acyltransferase (LPLAT)-like uncharacterized protein
VAHTPAFWRTDVRIRSGDLVPQFIGATLRLIARTWRIRITDHTGITVPSGDALPPVIWVLWHNRLLIVPILYERFLKSRKGRPSSAAARTAVCWHR